MTAAAELHGMLAEFDTADALVHATEAARAAGYSNLDAYAPFPIHELSEALGFHRTRLPLVVLVGGIVGGTLGFGMQYWIAAVNYPLNIGGRPLNSWPSFIPVTFELTVLCAALGAVLGMLALNGLPKPWHPLFNVPAFERATQDHFFLCLEAVDPKFHLQTTKDFLQSLHPLAVYEVPREPV